MESEAVARGDVTPLSSTTLGPYVYYTSLFIFVCGLFNPSCTTVRIPEGRLQRLVTTSDGRSASTVPVQSTEALRGLLPTRSGGDIRLLISTSRAQFECANTALLC